MPPNKNAQSLTTGCHCAASRQPQLSYCNQLVAVNRQIYILTNQRQYKLSGNRTTM